MNLRDGKDASGRKPTVRSFSNILFNNEIVATYFYLIKGYCIAFIFINILFPPVHITFKDVEKTSKSFRVVTKLDSSR